jgi:hypothetical protein
MLDSWWQLGELSGFRGNKLELWRITCAFCLEKGNFKLAFHGEKKKPTSTKRLNFDVYQCTNCMSFVHVLWSAQEFPSSMDGLHGYYVLPSPIGKAIPSENWPSPVQRFWTQAHESLRVGNWDAAAVMSRSALQFAMRDKGASGAGLYAEIEDLSIRGVLHPLMKDWSHEVRELGNDSAHPDPQAPPTDSQDAQDVVQFLDLLLGYLYDLPKHIGDYRRRKPTST